MLFEFSSKISAPKNTDGHIFIVQLDAVRSSIPSNDWKPHSPSVPQVRPPWPLNHFHFFLSADGKYTFIFAKRLRKLFENLFRSLWFILLYLVWTNRMEILGSQLLPSESDEQSHSNKRTKNKMELQNDRNHFNGLYLFKIYYILNHSTSEIIETLHTRTTPSLKSGKIPVK